MLQGSRECSVTEPSRALHQLCCVLSTQQWKAHLCGEMVASAWHCSWRNSWRGAICEESGRYTSQIAARVVKLQEDYNVRYLYSDLMFVAQ